MSLLKNTIARSLAVTAIASTTLALLLLQNTANAFPVADELDSISNQVVANGYARRDGDSSVFYTESYLDDPMSNTIRAVYRDSNRQPISYKQLNFPPNAKLPDFFEVVDFRRKRGYRVEVNNNIANVKSIRVAEDGSETISSNTDVAIDSKTVIDASFHRYILDYWDQLLDRKTVKINFLQIDRARLVPLKIKNIRCDTSGSTCFRISFDNFLLQGIVPSIYLQYDSASKNLLRYNGIGPITEMNGKAMPIDIVYDYM